MWINPADTNEKEAITDQKPNNHIALQPTANQAVRVLDWNWARYPVRHTAEIPRSGFPGTEHPCASSTNRSSGCIKASSSTKMYNWVRKRVSKTKLKLQNASAFLLIIRPQRSSKFLMLVTFNISTVWEKQFYFSAITHWLYLDFSLFLWFVNSLTAFQILY